MKVLMLSTDQSVFKSSSSSRERMKDYGSLVEELHIIVKNQKSKIKNQNFGNVFLYPTNDIFNFLYFFNAYKIAKKILVASGQWLITAQDPFETGLVGYWLKRKCNLPLQVQVHTDFLSPYFWRESVKNKIRVVMGRWLVKKADGLRVVSERIKNSLVASGYTSSSLRLSEPNGLKPVSVLPIFVDIQKIRDVPINMDLHQKYPDKFIILMASRLTKEKNIAMAIEAIRRLTRISTPINAERILLLIVGDGPEYENLKSQISNLKLQECVIIENWSDDLESYYKTADLFLLTSNYEGYGRTVVEATAVGLPVVMTDVGVAIGIVSPVEDVKTLVGNLKLLLEGKLTRDEVLKNQVEILSFYRSKEDFLNRTKQSWSRCLTSRILDSDALSESEQNK